MIERSQQMGYALEVAQARLVSSNSLLLTMKQRQESSGKLGQFILHLDSHLVRLRNCGVSATFCVAPASCRQMPPGRRRYYFQPVEKNRTTLHRQLFVSQSHHRVHIGRAASGDVTREKRDSHQQQRNADERDRVGRFHAVEQA